MGIVTHLSPEETALIDTAVQRRDVISKEERNEYDQATKVANLFKELLPVAVATVGRAEFKARIKQAVKGSEYTCKFLDQGNHLAVWVGKNSEPGEEYTVTFTPNDDFTALSIEPAVYATVADGFPLFATE